MSRLQGSLEDERETRKELDEKLSEDLDRLETRLRVLMAEENKIRKESEERLYRYIEERSRSLKEELVYECEHSRISIDRLRDYNDVQIPRLYELLRSTIAQREEQEDELI